MGCEYTVSEMRENGEVGDDPCRIEVGDGYPNGPLRLVHVDHELTMVDV